MRACSNFVKMWIIVVFVASFVVFFSATFSIFPSLPPGQLIFDIFGNPQADYMLFGVSAELVVSAIMNGILWSAIIVLTYSYLKGPSKANADLPIWVPGYTTSRNSSTIEEKAKKQKDTLSVQIIQQPQDIESVEGVGYIYGRKLRAMGINTVDDLLQKGSTIGGRIYLANRLEVTEVTVLNWLRQAEIHR